MFDSDISNELRDELVASLKKVYDNEMDNLYSILDEVIGYVKVYTNIGRPDSKAVLMLYNSFVKKDIENLALLMAALILREAKSQLEQEKAPKEGPAPSATDSTESSVKETGTVQDNTSMPTLASIIRDAAVHTDEYLPHIAIDGTSDSPLGSGHKWGADAPKIDGNPTVNEWK